MSEADRKSYGQILKSSAIIGGAQGIELVIRMARVKVIAMLLGPSGVGLIGLYQSTIELLGKLSGFGIRSSAVRQVAEARGSGDSERLGRTIKVLRQTCWLTGLLGWLLAAALAQPLSVWTFASDDYAWAFAALGAILLVENISGGQTALLQGSRKIEDLARVMVFSAAGGTVISLGLYAWLGEQGIVAALIASSGVSLGFSWLFSRRLSVLSVIMGWREIAREARPLITLGLAFMWGGILGAGVAFAIRALIIRGFGMDAGGMYQAAWAVSGLFAGFILNAMSQDFYPRLTAVAGQNPHVNRLVNEQTEIGILLALPGLMATLAFSPWIIKIFYTSQFMEAAPMLPWFVMGIMGRVVSWPMGFIQLAKGSSALFAATETTAHVLHLLFVWFGLQYLGLPGVAVAFAALYACHCVLVFWIAVKLTGFRWSATVVRLVICSVLFIGAGFCVPYLLDGIPAVVANLVLVVVNGFYCLQQLVSRIGPEHKISKFVTALPGIGRYFHPQGADSGAVNG